MFDCPPYGLPQPQKDRLFLTAMRRMVRHHRRACPPYGRMLDAVFGGERSQEFRCLEDAPFVPVSIFKHQKLSSVADENVFKVLTSSGTTGQLPSRVHLDARTALWQARALVRIGQHFFGPRRRPMVIVDEPGVLAQRWSYTARGAAIQGMMQFGHRPMFALRPDMTLDRDALEKYLERVGHRDVIFFGFTSLVWQYLVQPLLAEGPLKVDNAILVHSGGWKRMHEIAVSAAEFRTGVQTATGADEVVNFYGMAEQVGGVFFETSPGCMRASIFSEVLVRDPQTLRPVPDGETGVLQLFSLLPYSYPGHSLLTEDLGRIVPGPSSDDLQGRSFEVKGRVPRAEVRGCSDTFVAAASP